ncbi:hypothetical protein F5X99DRAFT_420982 [Biscogniauxia marginata]|nr:hypothetical protein F5X99DRAFT_420982 [Biscogniauxia marginata]
MPLAGLDLLSAETGIDILDLSALTEVQCGRVASSLLVRQPQRICSLIARRKPSYLEFVPGRYGHSSCLDDAVRCVATRARRVLGPSGQASDRVELLQYGAALHSLQIAVNDPGGTWKSPDVLCAIQVLSLFEIMHSSHGLGWSQHISGAAHLIRLRGPESFSSDFEKTLLLACTSPLIYECLIKGEACYLEEEPWQGLLRSLATSEDPFSPRSKLNISMSCHLARMPGLLREVGVAVEEQESIADDADLEPLRSRIRTLRKDLLQWRAGYDSALLRAAAAARDTKPTSPAPDGEDLRAELLGTCYGLSSLAARMLSAVSMDSVEILEDEAATHASLMLKLEGEVAPVNTWAGFYLGQKLGIINALLATTRIWRDKTQQTPGRRIASRRQFRAWARLIPGRQQQGTSSWT